MVTNSADKRAKMVDPPPVTPVNQKQAAERHRLQDALEDDEVYESLMSVRAPRKREIND
jgi:hypothetical protein